MTEVLGVLAQTDFLFWHHFHNSFSGLAERNQLIRVKHLIDDIMRAVISIKLGNFEDEENELGGNDESEKLKRRDLQEKSSWGFMRSNSIQASTVHTRFGDQNLCSGFWHAEFCKGVLRSNSIQANMVCRPMPRILAP